MLRLVLQFVVNCIDLFENLDGFHCLLQQADIRISSDFLDRDKLVWVQYISEDPLLDLKGVNVIFNDLWNWNDPNRKSRFKSQDTVVTARENSYGRGKSNEEPQL